MCIQLRRPRATGRIAFSARLLLNFSSGYFEETSEAHPKRQRVVASLSQNALWQCVRARGLDLGFDLLKQRLGFFQPQDLMILLA
jgi:hypothetical protein